MGRKARPTDSFFGRVIRERREQLQLSKADVADQLGFSPSFWEVLETGRRGCDPDDLPRIADALRIDSRGLAQVYFAERFPKLYGALFGEERPEILPQAPGAHVEDLGWRIDRLPRRERGIVEALVYALSDLVSRSHASEL